MNGLASLLRYQMGGPVGYVDGGQIDSIYQSLFNRPADADGRKFYEEKLKNASVADAIAIIGGGATGEAVNNEDLRQKIADETIKAAYENVLGRPEDVAGLQFYQDQVLNQGLDPTQIDNIFEESLEAQVRKDAEEFLRRLEAGESTAGIGRPLDPSQFAPLKLTPDIARDLMGRARTEGVSKAELAQYGGYDAVKAAEPPITPEIAADLMGRSLTGGVSNLEFDRYGGYDEVKAVYDASGGSYAPPGPATGDTVVGGGGNDIKAIADPPVSEYGYINDLYKTYFKRDASPEELASYAGIFGPTIEPNEIKDFILGGVTSEEITQDQADILLGLKPDPVKIAAETEAANAEGRPGAGQILGIPTFARQTPSDLTFAPLRRGLGQLRPAMSMTGLTSGQAAFGGVAPTPGQSPPDLITAQDRAKELIDRTYRTVLNRNPTQVGYDFYLPKILSGELNANNIIPTLIGGATSGPDKEVAANYAIQNPSAAQPFTLQTGAYGAPTPTFLARNSTAAGGTAAGPAGVDQPTYAQLLDNVQRLSAQVQPLLPANQTFYGSGPGGDGGFGDPSAGESATSDGTGTDSDAGPGGTGTAGSDPSNDSGPGTDAAGNPYEAGGLIRMAEGGELPTPPPMSKLSPSELGSTFDINDYIKEGILVGGMSKPIRDEYGMIIGYKSDENDKLPLPIQRDVVFGRELRDKETAMRLTDAEREQMMVEMAMRQGRTGISPTTGGLAGISTDNLMPSYMRRQPQYYSPAEQFRSRYAEGGIASVAQNLADKGRKGDSMLVHMTPDEVAGLQALAQQMGGSLTINPQTGLPEANIFKKLLPMALGFALGPAGAGLFQSALSAGLAVGAGYTLATGSLQQGLAAGLGAYGGSNLGTGLQAAGTAGADVAVGNAAANEAAKTAATGVGEFAGGVNAAQVTGPTVSGGLTPFAKISEMPLNITSNLGGTGSVANVASAPLIPTDNFVGAVKPIPGIASSAIPTPTAPITPGSALTGAERYFGDKATSDLAAQRYADATGSTLGTSAMQTLGGISLQSAADEQEAIKAQQAAIDEKRERRKRLFEEIAERTLGRVNGKSGGLMKLAGGGMSYMEAGGTTGPTGAPREVVGNGDGMSDSVPADIEGVQEARLADGEFVIPADVVADIGNGSSDAGSKKLYDMMDRIRKARHGTTEQPPEIQAERLMPA
jgi:hypothetical protein